MSKTSEKISIIGMIILAIALCAVRLTGPIMHVLCGLLLVVLSVRHLHPKLQKMKQMTGFVRIIDIVMLICLIFVLVSGMILHPLGSVLWLKIIHKLTGCLLIIGIIIHILQHRKVQS